MSNQAGSGMPPLTPTRRAGAVGRRNLPAAMLSWPLQLIACESRRQASTWRVGDTRVGDIRGNGAGLIACESRWQTSTAVASWNLPAKEVSSQSRKRLSSQSRKGLSSESRKRLSSQSRKRLSSESRKGLSSQSRKGLSSQSRKGLGARHLSLQHST